jgi:hypothetical protein
MHGRRVVAVSTLVAATGLLLSTSSPVSGQPRKQTAAQPAAVARCHVFPANNYWNTPIASLPRDPRSRQWLSHMSPRSRLHPDFGPSYGEQRVPYGIPVTVVGGGHPRVHVRFAYADESDHVRYPLGADSRIEGGQMRSGDRHAILVDKSRCRLYETFATTKRHNHWRAGSGATWRLRSNALRPQGWTSADAAGLPILPGLLRYREVEITGRVSHAVRFTTDVTDRRHVWPARHDAGSVSNHAYPPMGARFRLKAGFTLGHARKDTEVVLRAMKQYGLVLADNGSPWYFQGESARHWPSGLLDQLKRIPARAFVAVDTSTMQVRPSSGQADQG